MSLSATLPSSNIVYIGDMKETYSRNKKPESKKSVGVAAVYPFLRLTENGVIDTTESNTMAVPGDNVRKRRLEAGLSMRGLAEKCKPALDHTTIHRLEKNIGFTQDTLDRVATALGCNYADFFLPEELHGWSDLSEDDKKQIAFMVQNAALAALYKKAGGQR